MSEKQTYTMTLTTEHPLVHAVVTNTQTGEQRTYQENARRYRAFYKHDDEWRNPHGLSADDLAWGEAIGTLFMQVRDTFDTI